MLRQLMPASYCSEPDTACLSWLSKLRGYLTSPADPDAVRFLFDRQIDEIHRQDDEG